MWFASHIRDEPVRSSGDVFRKPPGVMDAIYPLAQVFKYGGASLSGTLGGRAESSQDLRKMTDTYDQRQDWTDLHG